MVLGPFVEDNSDIRLKEVLESLVKAHREPIKSPYFVVPHLLKCIVNFCLREFSYICFSKVLHAWTPPQLLPVNEHLRFFWGVEEANKVVIEIICNFFMPSKNTISNHNGMDFVFPSPGVNFSMKKMSIPISL